MFATKISMKDKHPVSNEPQSIDRVYIVGNVYFPTGWYKTDFLHDYLKANPDSIQVNLSPYPNLMPAMTDKNTKYVVSAPDKVNPDTLLSLPKE